MTVGAMRYLSSRQRVVTATVERLRRKLKAGPRAIGSEVSGRQLARVATATAPLESEEATGVA